MSIFTGAIERKMAQLGKSYWAARYLDRTRYEWEGSWEQFSHQGILELRLHCPDGSVATLGNTKDQIGGRCFQIHTATVGMGGRSTDAQIIGLVTHPDGGCRCYVWDYARRQLGEFEDNVYHFEWAGPVMHQLNFEVLGLKL